MTRLGTDYYLSDKLNNREALIAFLSKDDTLKIAVILHIKNFMKLITTYGSDFGQGIIDELTERLVYEFENSELYKIKTSEFLLCKVVNGKDLKNEILNIEKKVLSLIGSKIEISGVEINVKTHVGFATASGVDILKLADLALEEAKRTNKVLCVFSENLLKNKPTAEKNIHILRQIQSALKNNEVIAHYQPIINNSTGKCYKYESLVRVKGFDGNYIPPNDFLELVKLSNDYPEITKAMINRVFKDFSERPNDKVSINLTFGDITCSDMRDFIYKKLKSFKYSQNIIFEIVESEEVHDFEMLNEFIGDIKAINSGIGIAIDDFGTGFSNYISLSSVSADFIKIDGVLIRDIQKDKTYDLVKSITDFAKLHDLKIIAEYVDSKEIFALVKELGIEYSQGYYFSEALEFKSLGYCDERK